MARVELSRVALERLEGLIVTHGLPADTKERLKRSLRILEDFPLVGPELSGGWSGLRYVLGPWRWLLVIYEHIPSEDLVIIVTIQDARASTSATAARRRS